MFNAVLLSLATLAMAAPQGPPSGPRVGRPSGPRVGQPSGPQAGPPSGPHGFERPALTEYTATFDDLSLLTENVALQEIGPYDGLVYRGIDLVELGVSGNIIAGVVPQSEPNAAAFDTLTSILDDSEPYISTQYEGSVTDRFDFHYFYYGCVEGTVEAIASTLVACNITVTGYKASVQVAQQSFTFSDDLIDVELTAPMVQGVFSRDFEGIDTAKFSTYFGVGDATGATVIDSLGYTTYNAKDKKELLKPFGRLPVH